MSGRPGPCQSALPCSGIMTHHPAQRKVQGDGHNGQGKLDDATLQEETACAEAEKITSAPVGGTLRRGGSRKGRGKAVDPSPRLRIRTTHHLDKRKQQAHCSEQYDHKEAEDK